MKKVMFKLCFKMAKLRFSYGTMNSGKSLQILSTTFNYEQRGIDFIVLKSSIDTRDGADKIYSRAGLERKCIPVTNEDDLVDVVMCHYPKVPKWVFVDEVQFLTPEQIDQLAYLVDGKGIEVWCFGLRTDFKTHLFPASKRLFEIADTFTEMKSMCECGQKNIINVLFDKNGNIVTEGKSVNVGGEEKYGTMCRRCYYEKLAEQKNPYYYLKEAYND